MKSLSYTLRIRIFREEPCFGPGVMELMKRVKESGSLQTAAAQMHMAYSKAWKVIKTSEQQLGFPLTTRRAGGAGGGSSVLTPEGEEFLMRYTAFQRRACEAADKLFYEYFGNYK